MRRLLPLLLGLTALSSVFVAQSGAQTDKPEPGCAGVSASDGASDSSAANLEITRFWFNRVSGKTTANIEVKNLSKTVPSGATSVSWYVTWTTDAVHFVSANTNGSDVSYSYGDLVGSTYSENGTTSGSLAQGDKGVITITIPNDIGGSMGSKLEGPYATATENTDTGVLNLLSTADTAPDEGEGKAYTVAECAEATPVVPALGVKASTALGSAKKAAKKKSVSVKLTGEATEVAGTLTKGSKTYGSGTLAKVSGSGKLKLKLTRKVKKGTYTLALQGVNPDGASAKSTVKVKFKK